MLEELMRYVNNWFVVEKHFGEFTITDNVLSLNFLQDGQYFRIVGSIFNDGVYQYGGVTPLKNETFTGEVWALAVPKAFIKLAEDVKSWNDKYGEQVNSPYSSESFGGYSYVKAGAGAYGNSANVPSGWQQTFRSRLNEWRKI